MSGGGHVSDATITVEAPVMRAVGRPLALEQIEVSPPGPGEVRVRMVASGVCHSCLHAWECTHGGAPLPIILGDEGAGVVESVGSGVDAVTTGDHVVISWAPNCGRCRFCTVGRPALCVRGAPFGRMRDGTTRFSSAGEPVHHFGPATYAPVIVVDESAAVPIDPRVPLDRAALLGCAVSTGVGSVVRTSGATLGTSVAVFGCGGVGLNAVQGALLVGATPIVAVDLVESRLELARELGATDTVVASEADAVDRLRELSGGGFEVTIVAVGSLPALEQAWAVTARGGTCVVVGANPDGQHMDFFPRTLQGEKRLIGSTYGSIRPALDLPALASLYLQGRLRLDELVTRRFDPSEADEAFRALVAGELARGLIVFPD